MFSVTAAIFTVTHLLCESQGLEKIVDEHSTIVLEKVIVLCSN